MIARLVNDASKCADAKRIVLTENTCRIHAVNHKMQTDDAANRGKDGFREGADGIRLVVRAYPDLNMRLRPC